MVVRTLIFAFNTAGEDEKYTVDVSGMGTQAVCINDTAGSSSNVFQAIRCTTNGDSPSGSIDFLVNRSQFGGGDMFCFLNESNSGSSLFGVQGLDGATLSLFCRLTTSESTTTVNVLVIRSASCVCVQSLFSYAPVFMRICCTRVMNGFFIYREPSKLKLSSPR